MIDVAHNPHACEWLSHRLQQFPTIARWHAIFACMENKDARGMISVMQPLVSQWYFPTVAQPAMTEPSTLMALCKNASIADSVTAALQSCYQNIGADDGIIIFGSFLTIAPSIKNLDRFRD